MNLGQLQPAASLYRKAIATDPLRPDIYANLVITLLGQRDLDGAEQATRKVLALQPDFPQMYVTLATIDVLRGDAAAALRNAAKETDPSSNAWALAAAAQIGPDHKQADATLRDYTAKYGKDQPYTVADLHALRKQPDQMFEWLQRAWTQRDPAFTPLVDSMVLTYQHDPRFAALCKVAGLPLPGQPLPAAAASSGH